MSKDDDHMKLSKEALDTAKATICGPRREEYGHPREGFDDIARVWSAITGYDFTPRQVAKMMIGLKLCRDKVSEKVQSERAMTDNVVDILGYGALMPEVS